LSVFDSFAATCADRQECLSYKGFCARQETGKNEL
jgi:hypothetical protein